MFDEGENQVTMNLPNSIKHIRNSARENNDDDLQKNDYDPKNIRDFSINNWNGCSGLKDWGYKEDEDGQSKCV